MISLLFCCLRVPQSSEVAHHSSYSSCQLLVATASLTWKETNTPSQPGNAGDLFQQPPCPAAAAVTLPTASFVYLKYSRLPSHGSWLDSSSTNQLNTVFLSISRKKKKPVTFFHIRPLLLNHPTSLKNFFIVDVVIGVVLFAVCWSGITRCREWMRESKEKLRKHTSQTPQVSYYLIVLETKSL